MTNAEMLEIALGQSAIDCNCQPEDFLRTGPVFTESRPHPSARAYLELPFACDLVSYGSNVVAQTTAETREVVEDYVRRCKDACRCFETPQIHRLDAALAAFGLQTCFMAEYFLPDIPSLRALDCPFETRVLHPADFAGLYRPEWGNALCEKRKHLDVLGVGAYDGETLVGLAGCSADCGTMYQIGIDVLPAYRRRGVASALTSRLALEILALGKAPFYCAAWSNIRSVRNAVKCGFRPAWVTLTARDVELVRTLGE